VQEASATYFQEIRRFPMLKVEEEHMLAARWRERRDGIAAHQLLTSHLRLVVKIAMSYRRYGLPTSDLISEGNIGLLQAIERFDPDRGVRFSTYAIWWIKAAIKNYIVRSWSLVKMGTTANQKKLFFNLPRAKRRLSALQHGDLRPDQVTLIANELGVTEQDVVEMNRRLSGDLSLNAPLNEDEDSVEWQDRLVQEGSDQESHLAESEEYEARRTALGLALKALDDRERQIFEARRLVDPPLTLERLAVKLRISGERVRQIETRAFKKVQRAALAASAGRAFAYQSPTECAPRAHPRNSITARYGAPKALGRRISLRADLAYADAYTHQKRRTS
jgi:RNA polymerase sigma-32 factor